jgi:hypothetical protein
VVTETPELQVSVVADCDPTRVDDLEAVETTGIQVRVEYDEGLIWVQATAAPTSAYPPESKQPTASGHAPSLSDAAR